jgi:hypothetical protein
MDLADAVLPWLDPSDSLGTVVTPPSRCQLKPDIAVPTTAELFFFY